MKVSFITVAYNTPDHIRVLLRGFEEARMSFPFEYILVDNGSDGTGESVQKRFPWAHVLFPHKNLGFAKGNNLAVREASGEYIMLLNPDLTIFPGEMEKLIAYADAHPDVGVFGPLIEMPNGMRQATCTRLPTPFIPLFARTPFGKLSFGKRTLDRYHMKDIDHSVVHPADTVYGAAMLIRRSVFEKIGGFDERFFMYYEDVDFCRRVWESGSRVEFVPFARFVHYHRKESALRAPWQIFTNKLTRIHIASGVKYFWKHRWNFFPSERV